MILATLRSFYSLGNNLPRPKPQIEDRRSARLRTNWEPQLHDPFQGFAVPSKTDVRMQSLGKERCVSPVFEIKEVDMRYLDVKSRRVH
jgi:hypothetical protein